MSADGKGRKDRRTRRLWDAICETDGGHFSPEPVATDTMVTRQSCKRFMLNLGQLEVEWRGVR